MCSTYSSCATAPAAAIAAAAAPAMADVAPELTVAHMSFVFVFSPGQVFDMSVHGTHWTPRHITLLMLV